MGNKFSCLKPEDQDAQAVQERQYGNIQEAFNFQHIHEVDNSIEYEEYWSYSSSGFIYLESLLLNGNEPTLGWKFHISIHDEDRERAWNIIFPILIQYHVYSTKVLERTRSMSNDNPGREITIYAHLNEMPGVAHPKNNVGWQEVLQAIETQLGNANIRPNGLTQSDRQISGSRYISYRNDQAANGTYISAEQANGHHNPGNHPDNYQHIQLVPVPNLNPPNTGGTQLSL